MRNALQYSSHTTIVALVDHRESGCVDIWVSDDGQGVAEADLEQLFEPFFTGNAALAGAGIGLAIAWRAVELHGGTISACNADGGGLVITLRLPVGVAANDFG